MRASPVACDAVEDMGRLAAAEPGHLRHVAEIRRFPMRDSREEYMLSKRWRKRARQTELRAFEKMNDVVKHRVGTQDSAAILRRLIAGIGVGGRGT